MDEMTDRPPTKDRRLPALDAQRGLIMVLMALDHASYFIARVHSLEFWGTALPVYPNAFWFWTRWVTHPCAPGFFFLMGIGCCCTLSAMHTTASSSTGGWPPYGAFSDAANPRADPS